MMSVRALQDLRFTLPDQSTLEGSCVMLIGTLLWHILGGHTYLSKALLPAAVTLT